jgi:monoamine oxidase
VLLDFGTAIRKPVGRIHWAGTETSSWWNGYMDGAVRSGERASAEVLKLLK